MNCIDQVIMDLKNIEIKLLEHKPIRVMKAVDHCGQTILIYEPGFKIETATKKSIKNEIKSIHKIQFEINTVLSNSPPDYDIYLTAKKLIETCIEYLVDLSLECNFREMQ